MCRAEGELLSEQKKFFQFQFDVDESSHPTTDHRRSSCGTMDEEDLYDDRSKANQHETEGKKCRSWKRLQRQSKDGISNTFPRFCCCSPQSHVKFKNLHYSPTVNDPSSGGRSSGRRRQHIFDISKFLECDKISLTVVSEGFQVCFLGYIFFSYISKKKQRENSSRTPWKK